MGHARSRRGLGGVARHRAGSVVPIPNSALVLYAYRQAAPESSMPRGPKGQKRPADVIGNATAPKSSCSSPVAMRATLIDDGKDPAAKLLGSRGGRARAKALTPKRRQEIAHIAARARWKKKR
jgi:hypothetical protein